jgi:hypothetical protein
VYHSRREGWEIGEILGHTHHPCFIQFAAQFNVLWLDPNDPESFPDGLIDSLEEHLPSLQLQSGDYQTLGARLKRQIQRDALQESVVDISMSPTFYKKPPNSSV